MQERRLTVYRSARYYASAATGAREVWVVCHGYGQSAKALGGYLESIARPHRLIICPEGLSRFYAPAEGSIHGSEVGASWMTREDREREIDDYVRWIDRACTDALEQASVLAPERLIVLGFSQGGHTACRWVDRSTYLPPERCDRLILWGSGLPEDLDLERHAPWLSGRLIFVSGTRDRYVTPDAIARQKALLDAHGVEAEFRSFEGGHRLDTGTLEELAG